MAKSNDKIGPYTLVNKLGRGAFGIVWLAEKRTLLTTTKVALKLTNDEDVDIEAIKNEAAVWVEASGHPNVLPIIEADVYDEQVAIVSEYAPDGSLANWMARNGGKAPSVEAAVKMTDGILAGLEHLHERKIIHRDLKPDNILLQKETPRLADFGIARILKTTKSHTQPTGTPWYMAPEAFSGKRSEQTDIWAVGVILYQLLVGSLPFPQQDPPSLMYAILTQEPGPVPPHVPSPLKDVILRALHKDSSRRYESARMMRTALHDANRLPSSPQYGGAVTEVLSPTSPVRPRREQASDSGAHEEIREAELPTRVAALFDAQGSPRAFTPVHERGHRPDYGMPTGQSSARKAKAVGISAGFLIIGVVIVVVSYNLNSKTSSSANSSNVTELSHTAETTASEPSPTSALRAYYEAALRKDISAEKRYLSAGTMGMMEDAGKQAGKTVDEILEEGARQMPISSVPELSNEQVSGDTATVDIKIQGQIITMPMVKENGEWKLAMDKLLESIKKQG
jgi:serine/threonine protein kinase